MTKKTALVLGGGFAGLSAAIHLALQEFNVTLLERAPTLGGKASEFRQDGFRFDTGPSVFTLPHVIEDIFKAAGKPLPIKLEPLDLLCRYIFPSGRVWDVYHDLERTTAQLSQEEATVYTQLLNEARRLYEISANTFVYGQAPSLLDFASYGLKHGLSAHPFKTLPQLLDSFGATGELKQFFMRFATYFGADPYQAPAVLHNICWVELGMGVSYPTGGIYSLINALQDLAQGLGVNIQTNTTIEKLERSSNHVTKVVTNQGDFSADAIVSSLDIVRTHQLLNLSTPLTKKEPSLSGFVLLIGVKGKTKIQHHSISFAADYKREFDAIAQGKLIQDPTLYLNVSSKTNPNDAPEACENWFVMANAPALNANEKTWTTEQENTYAQHILSVLEERGFAKKNQMEIKRIISPNTLAKFAYRGSIYGSAPHSLTSTIRPQQNIRGINNLVLAGGSVFPGGGIPLAMLSGKAAVEKFIG